jgi:FkbM family methyltransferase
VTAHSLLEIIRGVCQRLRLLLESRRNRFLKECKAVVHVGASDGSERDLYEYYSLSVLWIEALPQVFHVLQENLRTHPKQLAVNALITDCEGKTYSFNVSGNFGRSSSIYDFGGHKELWPDVCVVDTIQLRSRTLPSVLHGAAHSMADFDALILDVQGAELLVLAGAGESLSALRFIKAEAADFEAYRGACTLDLLSSFLAQRGFRLRRKDRFAYKKGLGSYYNVLYERITA